MNIAIKQNTDLVSNGNKAPLNTEDVIFSQQNTEVFNILENNKTLDLAQNFKTKVIVNIDESSFLVNSQNTNLDNFELFNNVLL